jgi:hypothetical protein
MIAPPITSAGRRSPRRPRACSILLLWPFNATESNVHVEVPLSRLNGPCRALTVVPRCEARNAGGPQRMPASYDEHDKYPGRHAAVPLKAARRLFPYSAPLAELYPSPFSPGRAKTPGNSNCDTAKLLRSPPLSRCRFSPPPAVGPCSIGWRPDGRRRFWRRDLRPGIRQARRRVRSRRRSWCRGRHRHRNAPRLPA